jgi:glycyl-tRNA synthetase
MLMDIEELMGFAKRVGLFWPAADLYGGASGIYDYGHLGASIKRHFEDLWLSYFVERNDNYYMIEGSNILPEKPLVASGHAAKFNDIIIGCKRCKTHFRADVLLADAGIKIAEGASVEEIAAVVKEKGVKCPRDGGELGEPKAFNMMIDVMLGPEKKEKGYLRPETAQSVYLNFYREFQVLRKKLPLGLAIMGRAYRNEISPRQGLYRLRELNQAELQIFFDPEKWEVKLEEPHYKMNVVPYKTGEQIVMNAEELVKAGYPQFYVQHMVLIDRFYRKILNIPKEKLRFFEKGGNDKAFYNKVHMDIEADISSWGGFREIGGLHYRGEYDLTSHSKGSNQDLSVSIDGRRFMPNVLELSFGLDRNVWMLVEMFYKKSAEREVFMLPTFLSQYEAAILPLQKDEAMESKAERIYDSIKKRYRVFIDYSGSIGKRYARMDEIGTPYCITIDFDTVDSKSPNYETVTIRNRDDKSQKRVKISALEKLLDAAKALPAE